MYSKIAFKNVLVDSLPMSSSNSFEQNGVSSSALGDSDSSVEEDMKDWDWEDEVSGEYRHEYMDKHCRQTDQLYSTRDELLDLLNLL